MVKVWVPEKEIVTESTAFVRIVQAMAMGHRAKQREQQTNFWNHNIQQPLPWRRWLKWLAVVDVERQLILSQSARQAPWNDCANLPALVAQAHAHTPVGCVLADAEFDSERNLTFVRQQLHALSITPAKRGKKTWAIHSVRAQMRHDFPSRKYCRRALIETVFSVAKRKPSCRAPGRCLLTQRRQALLLGLTYNLYPL